ncbi:glutathione S-transferase N-terminal domain-containing protein [Methylocapsa polymorpha]|uniref:Glutathione S-transferase N-terminal domain-containing protein n=1 Tax=Methylocapsa polymorpha TaxID=3080828 RepID=A0ABZ0HTJ8_9HYPH|nr:glutathione S-transferase N-terminal domain-containing protein [Methylocapsa sp. RX1]
MPNLNDIWSHISSAFAGNHQDKAKKPKLYDFDLSGNAYKIRLLLNILGVDYAKQNVNLLKKEQKAAHYLKLNAFGEVPVFEDGDLRLRDSLAILIYVAGKYDLARSWWPVDAASQGLVSQWLATAGHELKSASDARIAKVANYDLDLPKLQDRAKALFNIIDAHLHGRDWLELGRPTIADIAVFPYTALAEDGGISLEPYPNLRAWIERVKGLPGFIPLPGR